MAPVHFSTCKHREQLRAVAQKTLRFVNGHLDVRRTCAAQLPPIEWREGGDPTASTASIPSQRSEPAAARIQTAHTYPFALPVALGPFAEFLPRGHAEAVEAALFALLARKVDGAQLPNDASVNLHTHATAALLLRTNGHDFATNARECGTYASFFLDLSQRALDERLVAFPPTLGQDPLVRVLGARDHEHLLLARHLERAHHDRARQQPRRAVVALQLAAMARFQQAARSVRPSRAGGLCSRRMAPACGGVGHWRRNMHAAALGHAAALACAGAAAGLRIAAPAIPVMSPSAMRACV